ncbi:IS110 family transposase [Marinospirillum sp. MEB164]|uniref:IS110 family transposase n=1 Tax=Marinospirillum alkalitolerans TaxID=3123374 RepID=A0ABW8Q000_9GAMM
MNQISVVGLDLAKNVFQVHAVDQVGQVVTRKKLARSKVCQFFAQLPPCLIGLEACASAHYWARTLSALGHEVKMIPPAFVKPYLKSNKNDRNDAEAICEAVQRPSMRFVEPKSLEQQAVLHLHHGRQQLVRQRVATSNHIRAVLAEYGIELPQGVQVISHRLPEILEDAENDLPMMTRLLLAELKSEHDQLIERADRLETQIKAWHKQNEASQRVEDIPGVGALTASALVATVSDGKQFENGRQLAAYLGLVPRQASSGGKDRLLGISKRGDSYLRGLLIHGARAVIHHVRRRIKSGEPGKNPWVEQLLQRCHVNEVAVALANKMARIAWVLLARKEKYQAVAA